MKIAMKTTIDDLVAALRVFTLSAADRHARKLSDERDRKTQRDQAKPRRNHSP